MTRSATARTDLADSADAGKALGHQIAAALCAERPHVVILFASSAYEYTALLRGIRDSCNPGILIGCSSAGEFTDTGVSSSSASAMALLAPDLRFSAAIGRNLRANRDEAVAQLVASFQGLYTTDFRYRSALILADALAGYTEEVIEQLTAKTAGQYQLFGGGAGDDAKFSRTHVFFGTEAVTDAVVALEILSNKPVGIGVGHGWQPASEPLRVTAAEPARVVSLNATPASEAYEDYAAGTGKSFNPLEPLPFFLHHVLGVSTPAGFKLRVPLSINPDQSISLAADVPAGASVNIMTVSDEATTAAAVQATRAAVKQLGVHKPAAALFFDCAATRLRMGHKFGEEIDSVTRVLGAAPLAGCNTYGQIARSDGQFSGFHNCTAVVCVIPE
jgi:hypothetical protein